MLFTRTDRNGYFSGNYPKDKYSEAFGITDASAKNERIPIPLERNVFPKNIILAIEAMEYSKEMENEKCVCDVPVPRSPDTEDIINSPETYSNDLGGGKCVDLTIPNRTIEEVNFYTVARTTEPQIKGLTLTEPSISFEMIKKIHIFNGDAIGDGITTSKKSNNSKLGNQLVSANLLKQLASNPDKFNLNALKPAANKFSSQTLVNLAESFTKIVSGRDHLNSKNPVDWDNTPTFYQATTISHGHILHIKQVWKADGYSIGDLLYSLPLAPCHQKQIAVIDWERREDAARSEQLQEQEQLEAYISRERDISEIVKASVREASRGGSYSETDGDSFGGGLGAWGQGSSGLLSAGVGLSMGGSSSSGEASSEAWQNSARRTAGSSMQHLQDTTLQSAFALRAKRSTVVQTVRQGERSKGQTEVVVNHNHCHAITIEYFEVLRHYQVSHELSDVQECLFIPLLMSLFDSEKALRWRKPLQRHLRKKELMKGFSAVERIINNYEGANIPDKGLRYCDEQIEYLEGDLKVSFHLTRPLDEKEKGDFDPDEWEEYGPFLSLLGGAKAAWEEYISPVAIEKRDKEFHSKIAPVIAEEFVSKLQFSLGGIGNPELPANLEATLVSDYVPNKPLTVTIRAAGSPPVVTRDWIKSFNIKAGEVKDLSKAVVHTGMVRYRTKHLSSKLFNNTYIKNDLKHTDPVIIDTPLNPIELTNPRDADLESRNNLISHLNEHIEYYHSVIWWNMDKQRRLMLLDGFIAPNSNGKSVASVVENRLVGIVGNCLVMPVSRGYHLDPTYAQNKDDPIDLMNAYAPTTPIPPTRISIPTSGVFAEAVMGSCNSCEKKDDSRFWRMEESPCGVSPTSISPISLDSRRSEPGDLKAAPLSAPIVAFQNAPPAPDPSGLATAVKLLGTTGLFKDITGLDQTQKNAIMAQLSDTEAAKFYAQKAAELAARQGISNNMDKTIDKIKQLMNDGDMDEAAGKKHIDNIVGSSYGAGTQDIAQDTRQVNEKGLNIAYETRKQGGEASWLSSLGSLFVKTPSAAQGATSKFWPNLDGNAVLTRLSELRNNANLFDQGGIGLCTAAAFFHHIIQKDPDGFYSFGTALYGGGQGFLGNLHIAPDSDLRNADYSKMKAEEKSMPPQADWMLMSSIRDSENWFFDFEGSPDETTAVDTSGKELSDWYKKTGLYTSVDYSTDRTLAAIKKINKTANNHIALWIKVKMFPGYTSDATHMIPIESPIVVDENQGKITIEYWTWGKKDFQKLTLNISDFINNYLGVITATF